MFFRRRIVLSDTLDNVLSCLRNQVRNTFLTDKVTEDTFLIHRSVTNSHRMARGFLKFLNFKFEGTIHPIGSQVELQYRVTPPIFWAVVFIALCLNVLYSIGQVLFCNGSVIFLLISVLVVAVMYGFAAWECGECIKAFESKFK